MTREATDNGIEFEDELRGPDGMSFTLFPVRGIDTPEDVETAKRELKRNRDVVGAIKVVWEDMEDEEDEDYKQERIEELREQLAALEQERDDVEEQLRIVREELDTLTLPKSNP